MSIRVPRERIHIDVAPILERAWRSILEVMMLRVEVERHGLDEFLIMIVDRRSGPSEERFFRDFRAAHQEARICPTSELLVGSLDFHVDSLVKMWPDIGEQLRALQHPSRLVGVIMSGGRYGAGVLVDLAQLTSGLN
jgi:hypothetical protein